MGPLMLIFQTESIFHHDYFPTNYWASATATKELRDVMSGFDGVWQVAEEGADGEEWANGQLVAGRSTLLLLLRSNLGSDCNRSPALPENKGARKRDRAREADGRWTSEKEATRCKSGKRPPPPPHHHHSPTFFCSLSSTWPGWMMCS